MGPDDSFVPEQDHLYLRILRMFEGIFAALLVIKNKKLWP